MSFMQSLKKVTLPIHRIKIITEDYGCFLKLSKLKLVRVQGYKIFPSKADFGFILPYFHPLHPFTAYQINKQFSYKLEHKNVAFYYKISWTVTNLYYWFVSDVSLK